MQCETLAVCPRATAPLLSGKSRGNEMLQAAKWLNVGLRAAMELGIVLGLGYWGYNLGPSDWSRIPLAVLMPAIGFGIWGLVDFRSAGHFAEALRLLEELVISGAAALAIYTVGLHGLAWGLAGLSAVHHALVYLTGRRLLE